MIRTLLARALTHLAGWLVPPSVARSDAGTPGWLDAFARQKPPSAADLLAELKNTAWTCAGLNAAACAAFPPRLYVATLPHQAAPKCLTRSLSKSEHKRLSLRPGLGSARVEEVTEHPLLDLLRQVNPIHNSFDLWELTTLYQEVCGTAYWLLEPGPLGTPVAIWILPAHQVSAFRAADSPHLIDEYIHRSGNLEMRYPPERIIAFRYPDPRRPYTAGLSPLRACFEQARLASELTAFKRSRLDNHALPDAIVSPEQVIGEEERDRLETQWNQKLRRGGAGRVLVAESALRVQVLSHSLGDLSVLADLKATREEICNAFHVPLAFLTSETNLANLQAAEHQHMARCIAPRLKRRDEKLNEQLIPLFDPTGRLFLAADDPVPANRELAAREMELHLKYGVRTINEIRADLGLPPVAWGDSR